MKSPGRFYNVLMPHNQKIWFLVSLLGPRHQLSVLLVCLFWTSKEILICSQGWEQPTCSSPITSYLVTLKQRIIIWFINAFRIHLWGLETVHANFNYNDGRFLLLIVESFQCLMVSKTWATLYDMFMCLIFLTSMWAPKDRTVTCSLLDSQH